MKTHHHHPNLLLHLNQADLQAVNQVHPELRQVNLQLRHQVLPMMQALHHRQHLMQALEVNNDLIVPS
jgi:hypothetical protein